MEPAFATNTTLPTTMLSPEWLYRLVHPSVLYAGAHLSPLFLLESSFHVILCFVLLGICASDYLCPNVASIADASYAERFPTHTQVRSTGALMAVLLSWCNSSPDLFSNLVSWTSSPDPTAAALSVGEVLGACGIILCVVEGSIFLIMASTDIAVTHHQKLTILRDLSFTAVAMLLMWYISIRNKVTVMNCIVMMTVYALYMVVKFSPVKHLPGHRRNSVAAATAIAPTTTSAVTSTNSNATAIPVSTSHENTPMMNSASTNTNISSTGLVDPEAQTEYHSTDVENSPTPLGPIPTGIKPSLISAMDYSSLLNMLEESMSENNDLSNEQAELISMQGNSFILPFMEGPGASRPHSIDQTRSIPTIEISDAPSITSAPGTPLDFAPYSDNPDSELESTSHISVSSNADIARWISRNKKYRNFTIRTFAPHLMNYKAKSTADRILSILTIPFVLILQISCPRSIQLLDYDKTSSKYSLIKSHLVVLALQAFISPAAGFRVLTFLVNRPLSFWLWLFPLCLSLTIVVFMVLFYRSVKQHNTFSLLETTPSEADEKSKNRRELERQHDIIQITFLVIGIINAILFISLIANCLIEMMELYQELTGISKAILGLTIFAWGNSISDLISNIAMCKFYLKVPHQDDFEHIRTVATKFFVIACTSCLGGVMLNSMIGIGLSGFISMIFVHSETNEWWFLRSRALGDEGSTYNYKFVVSCIFIMLQIAFLSVVFGGPAQVTTFLHAHRSKIGLVMCGLWGAATLCNIIIEIFG